MSKIKNYFIKYQSKKSEGRKASFIGYIGTEIYMQADKILNAKLLRPSMNEELKFIEFTNSTKKKVMPLIKYFIEKYQVPFNQDKLDMLTTMEIDTIFNCREFASLCREFDVVLRKIYKGSYCIFSFIPMTAVEALTLITIVCSGVFVITNILNLGIIHVFWYILIVAFVFFIITNLNFKSNIYEN